VATPLFCPFCEECFEAQSRCPDHDIPLVVFEELSRTRAREAAPDEHPVGPLSFVLGRGFLFVAAALWVVGFALPFAKTSDAPAMSGFALASGAALNFWMVPGLGLAIVSILVRRRTPVSMRSARVAVFVLTSGVGASLAFTLFRTIRAVSRMGEQLHVHRELTILAGPYVIGAGVLLGLVGALRLGHSRERAASYRVE